MNFGKIKKFTFALTLALGFVCAPGLSSLSTAQAQQPRGRMSMERTAFREGFRQGQMDARARRRFDYSSRFYRHVNRNYRDDFRRGYKQGFRRG
jgi:hypothetical protein